MQRKEVRIALGIVGCLLVIFAGALVWRLGFSGKPKTDEVAAAPDDKDAKDKDKPAAAPAGAQEHDAPTVLTATKSSSAAPKNAAAQTPAPAAQEADDKNWQSQYHREPAPEGETDYAAAPPEPSPNSWGISADQNKTDAFGDTSPYGYGEEPAEDAAVPEGTTPDQFAQHDAAAAAPEAEAQPTGKSRGNPIRQQSQTGSSRNPFRGAASSPAAADHSREAAGLTADAQEPRPNLHDDPSADTAAEAQPTSLANQPNALQNGWAITPAAQGAQGYEEDPVEELADTAQAGVAAAATNPPPPAQQRSTPKLLGNNPAGASAQPAGHRAAPVDAVVPTSAETEAPESPVSDGIYRVAAGDTYWRISRAIYGDPGYYRALYEHNRQRHPRADKLPAGAELETPSLATLEQMHPEFCPTKSAP